MKLPIHVAKFAGEKVNIYAQFADYFNHYMAETKKKNLGAYDASVSFAEKEKKINEGLMSEITRISGQSLPEGMSMAQFSSNPMIVWASFAVVNMMIDTVLPQTVIDSVGIYTDIRNVGFGDSASFDVKPRDLFTVSLGGRAQKQAFVQKQFPTTKTLAPVSHDVTVQVSLYKVLSGAESLAEFTRKAVISMETEMAKDAYVAMKTAMDASTVPAKLKISGYTQDALLTLCQTVSAYNNGQGAVVIGTAKALSKILPANATMYSLVGDSHIQLVKDFFEYPMIKLNQIAANDGAFGLALDDSKLYVMSPSGDKLIKGVLEGTTLTNTDGTFDNANLAQNATLRKAWACEVITNSIAGSITLA